MAFLTTTQALRAAPGAGTLPLAEADLRKAAARPRSTRFDIFLSHSSEDARVIAGVKALLERDALTVYVDWVEDPQLDRSHITPATANLLRIRMNHSAYLLYASSKASSSSRWMPWELGYFDGRRPGHIGILPIVANPGDAFRGVEYLALYPLVQRSKFTSGATRFARWTGDRTADTLRTMARS